MLAKGWAILIAPVVVLLEISIVVTLRKQIAGSEAFIYSILMVMGLTALSAYVAVRLTAASTRDSRLIASWTNQALFGCFYGAFLATSSASILPILSDVGFALDRMSWMAVWKSLALAIPAAVIEEIIFRGAILTALLKISRINANISNILQAALFSLVHYDSPNFNTPLYPALVFLAGLTAGYMTIKTKALWMPMGMHLTWNFANYALFGIHMKLLSSVNGVYMGYVDGILFTKIAVACLASTAAAMLLFLARGNIRFINDR